MTYFYYCPTIKVNTTHTAGLAAAFFIMRLV